MGKWCSDGSMHGIIWCYWLLLPWDQIGYWAVKIVTGVPDAIPVIGGPIVELLRGVGVGQSTLTRFYSLHTFVLPLATAVFMLMHFLMIRKQGISGPL
jgi:cytochrome b6